MARRTEDNGILRVYFDKKNGYAVNSGLGDEKCLDFADLAGKVSDYLGLDYEYKDEPSTYSLMITRRAKQEMGEKGANALEKMVALHNHLVRACRAVNDTTVK